MLQWTFLYMFCGEYLHTFLLGILKKYTQLLGHRMALEDTAKSFFQSSSANFYTNIYKNSSYITFLSIWIIIFFLPFGKCLVDSCLALIICQSFGNWRIWLCTKASSFPSLLLPPTHGHFSSKVPISFIILSTILFLRGSWATTQVQ